MTRKSASGSEIERKENLFTATHWSVVLEAKDESITALNSLCSVYRSPLITWLRCRGQKPEDAEDCVQGFFEQLLRREDLKRVDRHKGRFRTFLLTAFQNFLRDQHKHSSAAKRGGGQQLASLDEKDEQGQASLDLAAPETAPDLAYDRAWAQAALTKALNQLETECNRSGHGPLCKALEPVLFDEQHAPAYAQIAERLGMSDGAVKMAAHRIRKRLRTLIRQEVLQTVINEADLETELKYLQSLFRKQQSGPV